MSALDREIERFEHENTTARVVGDIAWCDVCKDPHIRQSEMKSIKDRDGFILGYRNSITLGRCTRQGCGCQNPTPSGRKRFR